MDSAARAPAQKEAVRRLHAIKAEKRLIKALNRLTSEEACRLIQIADPLTPEEQAQFGSMSNDELLAELTTDWTPETARRRVGGTFGT